MVEDLNPPAGAEIEETGQQRSSSQRGERVIRRRRPRHRESPRTQFVKKYRVELLLACVLLLGVLLFVRGLAHESSPAAAAASGEAETADPLAAFTAWLVQSLIGALSAALGQVTSFLLLSNWSVRVGLLLMLVGLIALPIRLRWWLMHASPLRIMACPRCGGTIHRARRTVFQKVFASVIRMRRYHCTRCEWNGIRIDGPGSYVPLSAVDSRARQQVD